MTSSAQTVPLSVALVAGALVALNPCSVPLLPAFLTYYIGADPEKLPRARARLLQGILVAGLLTLGVTGVFALIGLPLVYGAAQIADAVPWLGLGTGVGAVLVGIVALAGGRVSLPLPVGVSMQKPQRWLRPLLFGVGYGVASLGCSLPVFLAFVAASLSGRGSGSALGVLAAYTAGLATTMLALVAVTTLLRDGLVRRLAPFVSRLHRISGLLLVLAGVYLTYFWARLRFGSSATVADDPIVGTATRYSAHMQTLAGRLGIALVLALVLVTVLALIASVLRTSRIGSAPLKPAGRRGS